MILSPHEMAYVLKSVGFPADQLIKGVAMGLAESGGNTDIIARSTVGQNLGQRDHGWLQISGRWNYDKLQKTPNWRDPYVNAGLGLLVYKEELARSGDGWNAWSTYKDIPAVGTTPAKPAPYKQWLPDATFGVAHPFPPPPGPSIDLGPVLLAIANLSAKTDDTTAILEAVQKIRLHFA